MKVRPGDIPDICESVEYKGTHWRVTGFYKRNPDYIWNMGQCVREEAELIDIYAVCGALVRPDEVTRSFEYVAWSENVIQMHIEEVERCAQCPHRFFLSDLKTARYFDGLPPEPTLDEKLDKFFKELHKQRRQEWLTTDTSIRVDI